jgi:ankyrin repeat protein
MGRSCKNGAGPNCNYKRNEKNVEDNLSWTPLFFAISINEEIIVKRILDAGADICKEVELNYEFITPLTYAIYRRAAKIEQLLKQYGANR